MTKTLMTCKVTRGGRIPLGSTTMDALEVEEGDHLQIWQDDAGRVCIHKLTPPMGA